MKTANQDLLDDLSAKAKASPRKRCIYNFHHTADDSIHRMLNAMQPGTYIPPHKHENPDKREAFWVLQGKIALIIFNEDGSIREHVVMGPGTGNYGSEIPARTWHSLICLQENSVAYEVKDGPWNPSNDKQFASWAPAEKEQGALEYMQQLQEQLSI